MESPQTLSLSPMPPCPCPLRTPESGPSKQLVDLGAGLPTLTVAEAPAGTPLLDPLIGSGA